MKKLIELLIEMRWSFEVVNLMNLTELTTDMPIKHQDKLGDDVVGLFVEYGRTYVFVLEDEIELLEETYTEIKNW